MKVFLIIYLIHDMRKGISQSRGAVELDARVLKDVERQGYKYVQVKGLMTDKRYDYLAPRFLLLVPLKELPTDPREKDIYEPIPSPLLEQWAKERDEYFKIIIAYPS
jgi:hypothetical protein